MKLGVIIMTAFSAILAAALVFVSCGSTQRIENKPQEKFCNRSTLKEIKEQAPELLGAYVCGCLAGEIEGTQSVSCDSAFNTYNSIQEYKTCQTDSGLDRECSQVFQRRK